MDQTAIKTNFSILFVVLFAILLDGVTLGLLFPFLDSVLVSKGSSILPHVYTHDDREFVYSVVIFIYMLSWGWGNALVSGISDAFGRKPALIISLAGKALGFILTIVAVRMSSLLFLIVGRVIGGITNGLHPEAEAIGVDMSPNKRARARYIGYMLLPIGIGGVLAKPLVRLMEYCHLTTGNTALDSIYLALFLTLLALLFATLFFKETLKKKDKNIVTSGFLYPVMLFSELFKSRKIMVLALVFLLSVLGWSGFFNYVGTFAIRHYHFTTYQINNLFIVIGFSFALGYGFLVKLFHRFFGSADAFLINKAIVGVLIIVLLLVHSATAFWLLVFFIALFNVVTYVALLALFSLCAKDDGQGLILGIAGAIHFLAFALSTALAAIVLRFGHSAYFYAADVAIFASIVIMIIHRKKFLLES